MTENKKSEREKEHTFSVEMDMVCLEEVALGPA
jgi:hypothetical protein